MVGPSATLSFDGTRPIQALIKLLLATVQYALATTASTLDFEYPLIKIPCAAVESTKCSTSMPDRMFAKVVMPKRAAMASHSFMRCAGSPHGMDSESYSVSTCDRAAWSLAFFSFIQSLLH